MQKIITDLSISLNIEKYIVAGCYDIFLKNQQFIREQKKKPRDTDEAVEQWKSAQHIYLNQHNDLPYNLSERNRKLIFYTFCLVST
jgi:hypothetical protein